MGTEGRPFGHLRHAEGSQQQSAPSRPCGKPFLPGFAHRLRHGRESRLRRGAKLPGGAGVDPSPAGGKREGLPPGSGRGKLAGGGGGDGLRAGPFPSLRLRPGVSRLQASGAGRLGASQRGGRAVDRSPAQGADQRGSGQSPERRDLRGIRGAAERRLRGGRSFRLGTERREPVLRAERALAGLLAGARGIPGALPGRDRAGPGQPRGRGLPERPGGEGSRFCVFRAGSGRAFLGPLGGESRGVEVLLPSHAGRGEHRFQHAAGTRDRIPGGHRLHDPERHRRIFQRSRRRQPFLPLGIRARQFQRPEESWQIRLCPCGNLHHQAHGDGRLRSLGLNFRAVPGHAEARQRPEPKRDPSAKLSQPPASERADAQSARKRRGRGMDRAVQRRKQPHGPFRMVFGRRGRGQRPLRPASGQPHRLGPLPANPGARAVPAQQRR